MKQRQEEIDRMAIVREDAAKLRRDEINVANEEAEAERIRVELEGKFQS